MNDSDLKTLDDSIIACLAINACLARCHTSSKETKTQTMESPQEPRVFFIDIIYDSTKTQITCGPSFPVTIDYILNAIEASFEGMTVKQDSKSNITKAIEHNENKVLVQLEKIKYEPLITRCGPCGELHDVDECPLRHCSECFKKGHWTRTCPIVVRRIQEKEELEKKREAELEKKLEELRKRKQKK